MTKADLIEEVSQAIGMTRKDSEPIVDVIFESIVRAVRGADKVEIRGFGVFRTRQRGPRVGRNPRNGAHLDVPAKRIVHFKPGKELMRLLNPGGKRTEPKPVPADAPINL